MLLAVGDLGDRLALAATVAAHGVTDGPIGGPHGPVEASQLLLLFKGAGEAPENQEQPNN